MHCRRRLITICRACGIALDRRDRPREHVQDEEYRHRQKSELRHRAGRLSPAGCRATWWRRGRRRYRPGTGQRSPRSALRAGPARRIASERPAATRMTRPLAQILASAISLGRTRHHEQMLDRAVLSFADDCRAHDQDRQGGDVLRSPPSPPGTAHVQVRVEESPGDGSDRRSSRRRRDSRNIRRLPRTIASI